MIAASTHPLQSLKSLLADAVRRDDVGLLAECLSGRRLPALGGDQHPAEVVYQALVLPPVDPRLIDGVTRLLTELSHSRAAALRKVVKSRQASGTSRLVASASASSESSLDEEPFFYNLLLLASLLPTDSGLFAALRDYLDEGLRPAAFLTGMGRAARQLRQALIVHQTDDSLEELWLALIGEPAASPRLEKERTGDLLDAWTGLLWIPPSPEDRDAGQSPNIPRIARGLSKLHDVVDDATEGLSIIRYALRQLDDAYPRSSEFWADRLRDRLVELPQLVQDLVIERWPALEVDEGDFALTDVKAQEVWVLLKAEERNEISAVASQGESAAWQSLWQGLFFKTPPQNLPRQSWIGGLQRVRRSFEARYPKLFSGGAVEDDESEELIEIPARNEGRRRTRVDRMAAFDRVNRAIAAIEKKLESGELSSARRYLEDLIRDQEESQTEPRLIAKTLCNVAASAAAAGEFDWALSLYRDAELRAVDDPVARNGLADVLKAQEQYAEAEAVYRETSARFPNDPVARNGLADVLKAQEQYAEAEAVYRETSARFPNDPVARNGLADVLKAQEQYAEAEALYRETSARFPNDVYARTGLAEVLKAQELYAEAEALYRETSARFPNNVYARTGLAEVLKAQEQYAEAEALYRETSARFPNDVYAWNGLAEVLKAQEQYAEAEALYREIVARVPNDRVSRHGLANLLRQRRNFVEALLLVPEPREMRVLQDYYDLHLRGMILLAQGDVSSAIAIFSRGLECKPSRRSEQYFRGGLAVAYLRQGRYQDAEGELAAAPVDTPEVDTLSLHAKAGLRQTMEAKEIYNQVSARILIFRKLTAKAFEIISMVWGLRPDLKPRQPTPTEIDQVIASEIEMLMVA